MPPLVFPGSSGRISRGPASAEAAAAAAMAPARAGRDSPGQAYPASSGYRRPQPPPGRLGASSYQHPLQPQAQAQALPHGATWAGGRLANEYAPRAHHAHDAGPRGEDAVSVSSSDGADASAEEAAFRGRRRRRHAREPSNSSSRHSHREGRRQRGGSRMDRKLAAAASGERMTPRTREAVVAAAIDRLLHDD